MPEEKRKTPRAPTDLLTQLEILPEKTTVLGRIMNLGAGGMLFKTTDKIARSTKINVRFNLPPIPPGLPVEAIGRVVHSQQGVGFGVEFSQLEESNRKAIAKFVENAPSQ